jgi:hypothetical protein
MDLRWLAPAALVPVLAACGGGRDDGRIALPPATSVPSATPCRPAQAARLLQRHVAAQVPERAGVRLTEIRVENANGLGQVQFHLTRRGRAGVVPAEGKGAVDCDTLRVVAFGMSGGLPPGERTGPLCRRDATVVAGARVCGPAS